MLCRAPAAVSGVSPGANRAHGTPCFKLHESKLKGHQILCWHEPCKDLIFSNSHHVWIPTTQGFSTKSNFGVV